MWGRRCGAVRLKPYRNPLGNCTERTCSGECRSVTQERGKKQNKSSFKCTYSRVKIWWDNVSSRLKREQRGRRTPTAIDSGIGIATRICRPLFLKPFSENSSLAYFYSCSLHCARRIVGQIGLYDRSQPTFDRFYGWAHAVRPVCDMWMWIKPEAIFLCSIRLACRFLQYAFYYIPSNHWHSKVVYWIDGNSRCNKYLGRQLFFCCCFWFWFFLSFFFFPKYIWHLDISL